MKISYNNGLYTINLSNNETIINITTPNIFRCKETFLKHLSDEFDRAVNSQFSYLGEIEKINNTYDDNLGKVETKCQY